ncbi:MAG: DUF5004 domain-containing protein [Chitinophagales bacterium]
MKKLLAAMLIVVLATGCNKEKVYKENLEGEWNVYKYLLGPADKTSLFNSKYPGYIITFTADGSFTENYNNPDTVKVNGTYSFAENDEKLVLVNDYLDPVDSTTKTYRREFTIFNLTRDHVQLRTDSSEMFMRKKEQ